MRFKFFVFSAVLGLFILACLEEARSGDEERGPYSKKASSQKASPIPAYGYVQSVDSPEAAVTGTETITTAVTTTTTNSVTGGSVTTNTITRKTTSDTETNKSTDEDHYPDMGLDELFDSVADDLAKLHAHVEEWGTSIFPSHCSCTIAVIFHSITPPMPGIPPNIMSRMQNRKPTAALPSWRKKSLPQNWLARFHLQSRKCPELQVPR